MTEPVTEYIDGTALFLGVEAILTPEEKQTFLDAFCAHNAHLRGAMVADIIDMLDNADAHLNYTEPMYEMHGEEIETYHQPRLFTLCCYLAIYLHMDDPDSDSILWERTKVYMDRWQANRCGFQWRESPQRGEWVAHSQWPTVMRVCSLDKGHTYPVDHHDRRAYYPYVPMEPISG